MTPSTRLLTTLGIFGTMLVLVFVRPRRLHEGVWTMAGAGALLAAGLVTPREALASVLVAKSALLFLFALLALSVLVAKSGFFEWAAILCARSTRGDAHGLFRNVFILGALTTATMSLDTTAVMLTPIVVALARRLSLPAAPYVVLAACVANVGSLLLPVSNLTNILFAEAFHLTFGAFATRMFAAQAVALLATYALLRAYFRRDLPSTFDASVLPQPASVVPHRGYLAACVTILVAVLVGYFLAPVTGIEPYALALVGAAALVIVGGVTRSVGWRTATELPLGVFPFVVGLFVAVRGLEKIGLVDAGVALLARLPVGAGARLFAASGATALASNAMNNLPTALFARDVLTAAHADAPTVLATLVGSNVGPLVLPIGSLATMLVLDVARRDGAEVTPTRLVRFTAWATPLVLVITTAALTLTR